MKKYSKMYKAGLVRGARGNRSARHVARQARVSPSTLYRFERGDFREITPSLMRVAEALHIDYLLEGIE